MEFLAQNYWFEVDLDEEETELSGEGVESQDPAADAADPTETPDPDFVEVSEMLREGTETASPEPSQTPTASPEIESIDYVPYLENISIQLGVIDIVLVLFLLIFVIKQFVRVPR